MLGFLSPLCEETMVSLLLTVFPLAQTPQSPKEQANHKLNRMLLATPGQQCSPTGENCGNLLQDETDSEVQDKTDEQTLQSKVYITPPNTVEHASATGIPHPGPGIYINIAIRWGSLAQGYYPYFEDIYSDQTKYRITKVNDLSRIPSNTDIMFDVLPNNAFSDNEVTILQWGQNACCCFSQG